MNNQDDEFILVASVGKPIGLKGWAKVNSFTRPPENLFNYKNFFIDEDGTKKVFKIKKYLLIQKIFPNLRKMNFIGKT